MHGDCKGHTGGIRLLDMVLLQVSQKQKLDIKSSTEATYIGVNDTLPQVLWTLCFMEGQRCEVEKNELNQDDISSMKLKKNEI